jgi:hypothetical protein
MRKIGIITYHRGTNYGAFLQAWSLLYYLKITYPDDLVEIIDYQSQQHQIAEKKVFIPKYKRDWFDFIKLRRLVKYKRFQRWQSEAFKCGKSPVSDIITVDGYDTVIYGSDEIWNTNNWIKYVDPVLFGSNVKSTKVAYAPSFGSSKSECLENHPEILGYLKGFKKISVRDHHSEIILKLNSINSEVVLDPTFLIDWNHFVGHLKRPIEKKYIILNISRTDNLYPKLLHFVKEANSLGYEVINLTYTKEIVGIKNINYPTPFEWVNYYMHAEHVFTDTFHGTVFAINARKQFTIVDPGEKSNKIEGILMTCGIEKRFTEKSEPLKFDGFIDYQNKINAKIEQAIVKSKLFLNDI